ncbi:MAG: transcriptional regulator [Sedimenticolaceae bacterium]|jgi:HTH-type transcriptional regulator/antitoxin HigA
MDIRPIKTKRDYEKALSRVEALMAATPGTDNGDELDVLATLVDAYEQNNFPVNAADPVEAILFRMEQQGLERSDLEAFIGSRHRVSEVLNRKRGLSLEMIRKLHAGLGIPLEVLVGKAA